MLIFLTLVMNIDNFSFLATHVFVCHLNALISYVQAGLISQPLYEV